MMRDAQCRGGGERSRRKTEEAGERRGQRQQHGGDRGGDEQDKEHESNRELYSQE